jgi:hypothetical protein
MQHLAVPEKVLPCSLGGHHAGIVLPALDSDLGSGQFRTIMPGNIALLETRAMGGRIEASGLLKNNGFVL